MSGTCVAVTFDLTPVFWAALVVGVAIDVALYYLAYRMGRRVEAKRAKP